MSFRILASFALASMLFARASLARAQEPAAPPPPAAEAPSPPSGAEALPPYVVEPVPEVPGETIVVPQIEPLPPPPPPPPSSTLPPPSLGAPPAPFSDVRIEWTDADFVELERRERIARIGGGLLAVSSVTLGLAISFWYGDHEECLESSTPASQCRPGTALGLGVVAAAHGTGMMVALGALRATKLLRQRGIHVGRGLAITSVVFAVLPYGNAISWIFGWAQLAKNNRALRRLRPVEPEPATPPPPPSWD